MRKIAISLSKGGVGKTTTAVNLAAGLARSGAQVLLVDTDTQGQVTRSLGVKPTAALADLVAGDIAPEQAIVEARERLWVLAGGRDLASVKRQIDRREIAGERLLGEALAPFEGQYDYVILDTSPGWDALTVNVLFYAGEVLCPVSLEVLTLQGLGDFAQSLTSIRRYHRDLALRYVLPTFLDRRVKKSMEIMEQLVGYYGQQLCAPIRYNVKLSEAPGHGQTIFEFAPDSPGAEDYQLLVERVAADA